MWRSSLTILAPSRFVYDAAGVLRLADLLAARAPEGPGPAVAALRALVQVADNARRAPF